jgi:hypothetical protein
VPTGEPIISYIVEVGTTIGGTDVAVIDTGAAGTSYTLTGLRTSVNMYHARIRAMNACGTSGPSNEANPPHRMTLFDAAPYIFLKTL